MFSDWIVQHKRTPPVLSQDRRGFYILLSLSGGDSGIDEYGQGDKEGLKRHHDQKQGAINRYHLSRGTPIRPQFSVQAVGQNISENPSPKQ